MSRRHQGRRFVIGGEWAGRAYQREWPYAETCGGTAVRLRVWQGARGRPGRRGRTWSRCPRGCC
eukprot:scaffold936_cov63-Phaeocystis_antarctica.AAC.2